LGWPILPDITCIGSLWARYAQSFQYALPVRHLVPGEKRFVGKRIGKTLIEIDHDFPDTALLRLNMLSSKFWPIGLLPRQ